MRGSGSEERRGEVSNSTSAMVEKVCLGVGNKKKRGNDNNMGSGVCKHDHHIKAITVNCSHANVSPLR